MLVYCGVQPHKFFNQLAQSEAEVTAHVRAEVHALLADLPPVDPFDLTLDYDALPARRPVKPRGRVDRKRQKINHRA